MNKRTRFAEQANNVEERRREDEDAANIFAVMQVSHHEQVNAIKEDNATVMQMAQMQMKKDDGAAITDSAADGTVHEDDGGNAIESTATVLAKRGQGEQQPARRGTQRHTATG